MSGDSAGMLATEHQDRRIQFPCLYLPTGWMIFDTVAAATFKFTEHVCVLWEIMLITVNR